MADIAASVLAKLKDKEETVNNYFLLFLYIEDVF